ncbi:hypothetical protein IID19_04555 [Patescibacteria group bacterium]|nr:hypothetical protein [Patescibacteria group bacterium]
MSAQTVTMGDVLAFYQQMVHEEYRDYSPSDSAPDFKKLLHAKVAVIFTIQAQEYGISKKAAENFIGHELKGLAMAAFEEMKKWVPDYISSPRS